MKALWNNLNLSRPPTSTWTGSPGEFDTSNFLSSINKIIKELSAQDTLHTEAALLSRLIYRMKSKFRTDKGLKSMEKVNRALLNYLKLSLEKEYEYLRTNIEIGKRTVILPTRQMLQYVLARTQGFAKLMCRVEAVAMIAANYLKHRINLGQAWTVSTVAYATVSRIWLLSKHLIKQSCTWYDNMYPYVGKLKLVGIDWLPSDYHLPEDFESWLAVPWINEDIQCVPEEKTSDSIFSLIKSQSDDEVSEDIKEESQNTSTTVEKIDLSAVPDIGEKISRTSFAPQVATLKAEPEEPPKKRKIKLMKIKTKEDLSQLLNLNSYPGLDKLQWNMLKRIITKTLVKLDKYPPGSTKHELLIDKVIRSIRDSVS